MPELSSDFQKMFDDQLFTDLEIKAKNGQILKAHRSVLAVRSPEFYAMLTDSKTSSLKALDFDSKTLKELLRFIYCEKVEGRDNHNLLLAAEKYGIAKLKRTCIQSMIRSLTAKNVIETLVSCNSVTDALGLYHKCVEIIIR